jgi:Flp pilus assembly protein TadG
MADAVCHRRRRFGADQAGAALVEMTIITPLILALAAGVFEFSNIIHTKLLLEAGVRDGALYIARCAGTTTDCDAGGKQIAVTGESGSDRITGWVVGDVNVVRTNYPVTVDPDTGLQNYRSASVNVTTVEVETLYTYTGTGLWAYLGFGALTLRAAHEERVLGN